MVTVVGTIFHGDVYSTKMAAINYLLLFYCHFHCIFVVFLYILNTSIHNYTTGLLVLSFKCYRDGYNEYFMTFGIVTLLSLAAMFSVQNFKESHKIIDDISLTIKF